MTFNELIAICKPIDAYGPKPDAIDALTQDSRSAKPGTAFIAVRGTQVDGHLFIDDAVKNGASVIICEEPYYTEEDVCIIEVENTRTLLGTLAQSFEGNPAEKLSVIGITGTNGKTTVATLTYQALQKLGAHASLLGTVAKRINDEIIESKLTTSDPIELARDMRRMVDAGSKHLVMEVSSHALDQKRVDGITFSVATFTNLSHDHLDYHATVEEYAAAKKQLFDGLSGEAVAVINQDDEQASFMVSNCEADVISFSFEGKGNINCRIKESNGQGITINVDGTTIKSPMVGRFNAYNVAETFLICRVLGYDTKLVAEALHDATGAAGRLQRVEAENQKHQPTVLVDYAHTPDALKNVLESLAGMKQPEQNLHVIFGCGGDRDKTKRPKMAGVAEDLADKVTVTSDNPRGEDPDAIIDDAMKGFIHPEKVSRITDRRKAIEQAIAEADEHTIILIAGKGHETYQEIKGTRHPFDDRDIARKALSQRNGNPKTTEVR